MNLKNKNSTSILTGLITLLSNAQATTNIIPKEVPPVSALYGPPTVSTTHTVLSITSIVLPFIIGIIVALQKKLTKKTKIITLIILVIIAILAWNLVDYLFLLL